MLHLQNNSVCLAYKWLLWGVSIYFFGGCLYIMYKEKFVCYRIHDRDLPDRKGRYFYDSFFLILLKVSNTLSIYICPRLISNHFCILYKNHYENAN